MDFREKLEIFLKHEYGKNVPYHYIEAIEMASDMDELVDTVANLKRSCNGMKNVAETYINNVIK